MSLIKASALFAGGTMISRLFGIVRESVVAGVFGASLGLDAFLVANRIPNMLRELLAEGALGSSFTKVFAETWEKSEERATRLLRDSLAVCLILAVVVCVLGIVAAPWLVDLMTAMSVGRPERELFYDQTVGLTRLLFPFIGLMIMGAIAAGALHQRGRFFTAAASPIALNIGYLIGALLFAEFAVTLPWSWLGAGPSERRVTGLALGVVLGGLLQLVVQLAGIWRPFLKGLRALGRVDLFNPDVKRVFWLMGPMIIASSAGQINVLVNTNFATSLPTGAVAWLSFSFRILQLPIGLFAVAIGSVALPRLTRAVVASRQPGATENTVGQELGQAMDIMLWLMLPCSCFVLASALPICQLLLQYGAYTADATNATAAALFYYAFSLTGYGLIKVLTSYYYAVERTRFAMQVGLLSIVVNYLANSYLVNQFGHTGLAMTSSVVLSGNALFLIAGLQRDRLKLPLRALLMSLLCLSLATGLAYFGQTLSTSYLESWSEFTALNLKLRAAITITTHGLIVAVLFISLGLIRLQKSPRAALALIKSRMTRRSRKTGS